MSKSAMCSAMFSECRGKRCWRRCWRISSVPEQMADLARGTLRRKIPQIVEALEGHRMSDHHRLLIRQSLKHMQFIEEMIEELDKQIREKLAPYPKPVELVCTGTWDWKRCRSQYSGGNRNGDERQRSLLPVVTIWLPGPACARAIIAAPESAKAAGSERETAG